MGPPFGVPQSSTRGCTRWAPMVQTGPAMRCASCEADNPAQARFCHACGEALSWRCAGCGAPLAPAAKFCGECGRATAPLPAAAPPAPRFGSPSAYTPRYLADKILTSQTALEGERKQVTVLFADLQ